MAVAAWLFGIQEFYCVALAALAATVAARIWVDLRRFDLDVRRVIHPARVSAGQEARVELVAGNPGRRDSPPVEAHDPFDGGRGWARFVIAPLRAGEVRSSSYRLPSARRGVHRLGPLELRLSDPLGLATSTRVTSAETSLTVHPRYELVAVHGVSAHRDYDRRRLQPSAAKGGSEFHALRPYIPGDDLRHVHWPTTARLDDLVIRQPENLRRGRLTLLADLRSDVQDDDAVEAVLSAVASLAMSALQVDLQVRVVTTAGWDSGHGTGRGHGPALLDGLAAAAPHPPRAGAPPFRIAGGMEPVVVVTTDLCSERDLQSVVTLGGGATTLVVFETAPGRPRPADADRLAAGLGPDRVTTGHPSLAGGRRRRVRVPLGTSFGTAWAAYAVEAGRW